MQEVKHEKTIHFSIDDVLLLFQELDKNFVYKYFGIFHHPILKMLKKFYEKYGITSTLYCYFENNHFDLTMISNHFQKQFEKNSHWLKVAFHGKNENSNYNHIPLDQFIIDYQQTTQELMRICGTQSISSTLRLHLFAGSKENCKYLKEELPNLVLLGADDTRNSYYLSEQESQELYTSIQFHDPILKIDFIKTDLRLERENFEKSLQIVLSKSLHIQIFTHEWCFLENIDKVVYLMKNIQQLKKQPI